MVGAPVKPTAQPIPPQKSRPAAPQRETGALRRNGRPGPIFRIAVSLLIVWHFAGVFLAGLAIPATSPLVLKISQQGPMLWYLDALYLNQQHSFFAPDVGPGHLIRYQLFDQSGRVMEQGELPNRKNEWPRLFYHRHMMLADQSEFPIDDKQYHDYWERKFLEAYADHLLRVNDNAQSVRLQRIAHQPLPRDLALQGKQMTDPESYQLLMEVTRSRSQLVPPPPPPSAPAATPPPVNTNQSLNWQRDRANVASRWSGGPLR